MGKGRVPPSEKPCGERGQQKISALNLSPGSSFPELAAPGEVFTTQASVFPFGKRRVSMSRLVRVNTPAMPDSVTQAKYPSPEQLPRAL